MRGTRPLMLFSVIMLFSLGLFTFADSTARAVQAVESDARIIYNGREAVLSIKPYSIEGYNYLSVRSVAELFGKGIEWNQAERKVIITDPPNYELESLKAELAERDKSIAELQDKMKSLEKSLSTGKELSVRELQDEINRLLGVYEELEYRTILSGNKDEIRVRIEIDLGVFRSEWSSLSAAEKEAMIDEVYEWITAEYENAKVKGYVIDIDESKIIMPFHYNWTGEIEREDFEKHSSISSLEEKLNNDYSRYFDDIHFTITLDGNESNMEFTIHMQGAAYSKEWERLSDNNVKYLMEKVSAQIMNKFGECHVLGYVYDTDSESILAYCEQMPGGRFIFEKED